MHNKWQEADAEGTKAVVVLAILARCETVLQRPLFDIAGSVVCVPSADVDDCVFSRNAAGPWMTISPWRPRLRHHHDADVVVRGHEATRAKLKDDALPQDVVEHRLPYSLLVHAAWWWPCESRAMW